MSPVDYHAWTHRPKAQGGTDPIEVAVEPLPWVILRDALSLEHDGSEGNKNFGYSVGSKNYDPDNILSVSWNAGLAIPGLQLTVNEEGIYLIDATFNWDGVATGTGDMTFSLNPSDCYDPIGLDLEDATWVRQKVWDVGATYTRISGIISLAGGADGTSSVTFTPYFNQTTGTTKFGGSEYLKVIRLQSHGPYGEWETFSEP